jgi:hypothetical protein
MNDVVELDECRDEISGGRYPPRARAGKSNSGGGGGMDDVLKRLGAVEETVSETRSHVSGIVAVLPHLATKADVSEVRVEIASVRIEVAAVRVEVAELGSRLIKWLVATGITTAGLAVTAMKFFR